MQITETSNEGLKRTLQVVVGADELGRRFTERLGEIKDRVQLKGFRKGKVPVPHLKKVFGRSLMAEVLQEAVKETTNKALADRNERPAMQPSINLPEDQAEIERVLSGEADLAYSVTFEVLPKIELADFTTLKLERLVAEAEPEAIEKAVTDLAARGTTWTPEEGREAQSGDRLTVDFVGKLGEEAFEGGSAEGAEIVLGQGSFIPGFEEGLTGAKAGEDRTVVATFPADYPVDTLAGKEATFAVTVKEVALPARPEIDDAFAKSFGMETLDQLKEAIAQQIKQEYDNASRMKLKRELLDQLDSVHSFELPPTLVGSEFEALWKQYNDNLKQSGKTLEDEGKTEDEVRADYQRIAERRVRLGLVIGEIAESSKVEITQDEMRRALMEQARRFPGHEKSVYEYYEKTPGALAELRAPIFEDKVVDFVLEQVNPAEKKVSKEELFQQVEAATAG
jgi:trigger factor